ncbi:MAG: response regulator, partial [Candidatus Brocadiae bacterium]|nr:response regulator [Candidatus Brocadiia bacterium]
MEEKRPSILVIDSTHESLSLFFDILDQAGYYVRLATSGEIAIAAASENPPDLILLGVCVKGMDGLEVCRCLKNQKETKEIPILLIRASDEEQKWLEGLKLGVADYVSRPIHKEELLSRVQVHLSLKESRSLLKKQKEEIQKKQEELQAQIARYIDLERKRNDLDEHLHNALSAGNMTSWEWDIPQGTLSYFENIRNLARTDNIEPYTRIDKILEMIHPEDRQKVQSEVAQIEKKNIFECEYRVKMGDGEYRWIYGRGEVKVFKNHKPQKAYGISIDITERKKIEENLALSLREWQITFDASHDLIWIIGKDHKILRANKTSESFFHCKIGDLVGRPCWEVVHRLSGPLKECPLLRSQKSCSRERMDLQMGDRWFEVTIDPVLDELGQYNGAVHTISNITDRKLAEKELLQSKESLEKTNAELEKQKERAEKLAKESNAANNAKSEFLANMSHEIRTPLNGILGMVSLLLDTSLAGEQKRYTEIIQSNGKSLLAIINDILDYSKMEAQKVELEIVSFDLSALLDDFSETMALRAQEKGLELLFIIESDVPVMLYGDPGRLRQILSNLVGNAIKFTNQGEVLVSVSLEETKENDEVCLRFSVKDTGIGIPKEKIALLFYKFSQVDSSVTRKYEGTGLGLAISKNLAELMGGKIGVISEENQGSEFWFTVNLKKQRNIVRVENLAPPELKNVRILVVAGNENCRKVLCARIASWGMRPSEASNANQALQLLFSAFKAKDPYMIALIDIKIHGIDGERLGSIIQADEHLKKTRMVLLTPIKASIDTDRFLKLGFVSYLSKPVQFQEMKNTLSLAIALPSATKDLNRFSAMRRTTQKKISLFEDSRSLILVVEDNIANQQVAMGILKKLGLRADAVANGQEAIKSLEYIPYDLILMDIQMPVMDGYEATRQIRSHQSPVLNHNIPIIAMTAHAMQGDRQKCMDAGMDDYITKPVSPQILSKTLEYWLSKSNYQTKKRQEYQKTPETFSQSEKNIWNKESMLSRVMDDRELFKTIVKSFLQDIPR